MLVGKNIFDERISLHLMNPSNWALGYVVLVFEPSEEARQNASHVVNSDFASTRCLLIMDKIVPHIVSRLMDNGRRCGIEIMANGLLVVVQRFGRATFNLLSCNEAFFEFLIVSNVLSGIIPSFGDDDLC